LQKNKYVKRERERERERANLIGPKWPEQKKETHCFCALKNKKCHLYQHDLSGYKASTNGMRKTMSSNVSLCSLLPSTQKRR
jgi:hypothetical protein